ncbi:hypothetical protein GIB67_025015 [Kingdonia uniflora]|uniref:Alcohol dehydrogenase-like N-terminal domain-containing protein n=1 Tax=Kingdonia uniflora TaxID=39325 RepID=A0A7J7N7E2_9MAGN|nr:hypothetical protein GIB67_025015 [Kingdonia uniflora]
METSSLHGKIPESTLNMKKLTQSFADIVRGRTDTPGEATSLLDVGIRGDTPFVSIPTGEVAMGVSQFQFILIRQCKVIQRAICGEQKQVPKTAKKLGNTKSTENSNVAPREEGVQRRPEMGKNSKEPPNTHTYFQDSSVAESEKPHTGQFGDIGSMKKYHSLSDGESIEQDTSAQRVSRNEVDKEDQGDTNVSNSEDCWADIMEEEGHRLLPNQIIRGDRVYTIDPKVTRSNTVSVYENQFRIVSGDLRSNAFDLSSSSSSYPFVGLRNLVMVAGHSVCTSGNCGNFDEEDSWFLESYQKHKGQATIFKVIMGRISENCLGWAVRDTSGVLSPYNFIRRDTGPDHASLTITHYGIYFLSAEHEIVGIVKEVGSNVCRFKVGDHVGVGPYVNSCKTCEHCKIREEAYCDAETTHTFNSIDEDGTITRGGYSSYIVVQEGYVFKIPDNYPLVSAAPLLCARITVYAPMMRHKVNKPSKYLGVVGSGGLGHLAVKFGKAFGLHVTVFSTSNSKKDEALNLLGADKFIISSNMQQMEHLNNFLDRSSHDTLSEKRERLDNATVSCSLFILGSQNGGDRVPLSVDLQVEECKFIFEAKTIQRMELLVLSTLKWRLRAVTPFTFMDYFFRKNNDDLPPPSSQISRLVELILWLTRGIKYLEFKPSEVATVVPISVIRETNLDKSTKDHVSHEDESKTSKDSVESSENDV